jgi:hypothetical protein
VPIRTFVPGATIELEIGANNTPRVHVGFEDADPRLPVALLWDGGKSTLKELSVQNDDDGRIALRDGGNVELVPRSDATAYVGGTSGTQPAVLGNACQSVLDDHAGRLATLESRLVALTAFVNNLSLPVSGGAAGPPTPAHTAGAPQTASAANVKAVRVQVK